WGAYNIVQGNITYGVLTEVISLITQIQGPISGLTGIFPTYFAATASAERIMEIENLPNEKKINDNNLDVKKTYDNLVSIDFENITFSYDRDVILDNTSLSINKGDFVAIMGITGIGKSTLMKLLMSVFPIDGGSIYMTLNNGEKMYVDKNLRRMFAYVPQGNFLLSGTIRENLTFVAPNATDEDIYRCLDLACADFMNDLPKGLETRLGERGVGLSEGQIQRLAIARALLTEAPILLLDECTSALDEETEKKLLTNLKMLKNKTCIIITHKKAALSICNKEVIIRDKKIVVKET
ncbi:MAG: ABC transporter ATP-binding protein, partial [Ruminococcus sp.]